jgi:hypothetical protein
VDSSRILNGASPDTTPKRTGQMSCVGRSGERIQNGTK